MVEEAGKTLPTFSLPVDTWKTTPTAEMRTTQYNSTRRLGTSRSAPPHLHEQTCRPLPNRGRIWPFYGGSTLLEQWDRLRRGAEPAQCTRNPMIHRTVDHNYLDCPRSRVLPPPNSCPFRRNRDLKSTPPLTPPMRGRSPLSSAQPADASATAPSSDTARRPRVNRKRDVELDAPKSLLEFTGFYQPHLRALIQWLRLAIRTKRPGSCLSKWLDPVLRANDILVFEHLRVWYGLGETWSGEASTVEIIAPPSPCPRTSPTSALTRQGLDQRHGQRARHGQRGATCAP